MNSPSSTIKRHAPLTLRQAAEASAPLAGLLASLEQTKKMLALVQPAIPVALRPHIKSGKLDGKAWTLLTPHAAASAKLKQLLPALKQRLEAGGYTGYELQVQQVSAT